MAAKVFSGPNQKADAEKEAKKQKKDIKDKTQNSANRRGKGGQAVTFTGSDGRTFKKQRRQSKGVSVTTTRFDDGEVKEQVVNQRTGQRQSFISQNPQTEQRSQTVTQRTAAAAISTGSAGVRVRPSQRESLREQVNEPEQFSPFLPNREVRESREPKRNFSVVPQDQRIDTSRLERERKIAAAQDVLTDSANIFGVFKPKPTDGVIKKTVRTIAENPVDSGIVLAGSAALFIPGPFDDAVVGGIATKFASPTLNSAIKGSTSFLARGAIGVAEAQITFEANKRVKEQLTLSEEQKRLAREQPELISSAIQSGNREVSFQASTTSNVLRNIPAAGIIQRSDNLDQKNDFATGVEKARVEFAFKKQAETGKPAFITLGQTDKKLLLSTARGKRDAAEQAEVFSIIRLNRFSEVSSQNLIRARSTSLIGKAGTSNSGQSLNLAQRYVTVRTISEAGAIEGATGEFIQQQGRNEDINPTNIAIGGGVGAISAGSIAEVIERTKASRIGPVVQGFAYASDPPEIFGDVAASGARSEAPRVSTIANTFAFTNTNANTNTFTGSTSTGSSSSKASDFTFTGSKPSKTNKLKSVITFETPLENVAPPTGFVFPTNKKSGKSSKTDDFIPSISNPKSDTFTNTNVNINPSPVTNPKPVTFTNTFTNTITNSFTNTNTNIKTLTNTNTIVLTPKLPAPFLPLGGSSGGFKGFPKSKRSKQPKFSTPSFGAVVGKITGKRSKVGEFTGLTIRPIIESKGKKKKNKFGGF